METLLAMLKADLEKPNNVNDDFLTTLIDAAVVRIKAEGVTLSDPYTADDQQGIVMYAAYLYRRRNAAAADYRNAELNPQGMPYMLRLWLNNRVFGESMS